MTIQTGVSNEETLSSPVLAKKIMSAIKQLRSSLCDIEKNIISLKEVPVRGPAYNDFIKTTEQILASTQNQIRDILRKTSDNPSKNSGAMSSATPAKLFWSDGLEYLGPPIVMNQFGRGMAQNASIEYCRHRPYSDADSPHLARTCSQCREHRAKKLRREHTSYVYTEAGLKRSRENATPVSQDWISRNQLMIASARKIPNNARIRNIVARIENGEPPSSKEIILMRKAIHNLASKGANIGNAIDFTAHIELMFWATDPADNQKLITFMTFASSTGENYYWHMPISSHGLKKGETRRITATAIGTFFREGIEYVEIVRPTFHELELDSTLPT